MKLNVGDKIHFANEVVAYRVRACDDRYAICTRPFNFRRTVLYSIIDLVKNWRGPNNLVFNAYDYMTDAGCVESLAALQRGELDISRRNGIELSIIKVTINRACASGQRACAA